MDNIFSPLSIEWKTNFSQLLREKEPFKVCHALYIVKRENLKKQSHATLRGGCRVVFKSGHKIERCIFEDDRG